MIRFIRWWPLVDANHALSFISVWANDGICTRLDVVPNRHSKWSFEHEQIDRWGYSRCHFYPDQWTQRSLVGKQSTRAVASVHRRREYKGWWLGASLGNIKRDECCHPWQCKSHIEQRSRYESNHRSDRQLVASTVLLKWLNEYTFSQLARDLQDFSTRRVLFDILPSVFSTTAV